ncbi:MAG TPA: SPFH domain-containing protein [Phycisphaerae bacterium]|nr:SPFH domain-containing protein [Phycisphaerae bacterium]HRR84626.1 SPFH domain-containing protein [Phycisphaerae bacterium]
MSAEYPRRTVNGWGMLGFLLVATLGLAALLVYATVEAAKAPRELYASAVALLVAYVLGLGVVAILWAGFFTLQPNEGAVLLLFGAYRGTSRRDGLQWANPFYKKLKISLRARNLNGDKLKVNDQRGNPIEIAAVVVWRVQDTAQAFFDVDRYENYVSVQSESAVRHLASKYPYDSSADHELSLRGSMDEVSRDLQGELQERLSKAGVVVEEARLSHLAYAPEIAGAMLRRQQAEAVVAARTRIVEGAVGMVETALQQLEQHKTVELDDERKAAMVSNLLVVLCGEQAAQPVVNTGTLYT